MCLGTPCNLMLLILVLPWFNYKNPTFAYKSCLFLKESSKQGPCAFRVDKKEAPHMREFIQFKI